MVIKHEAHLQAQKQLTDAVANLAKMIKADQGLKYVNVSRLYQFAAQNAEELSDRRESFCSAVEILLQRAGAVS
jgi:hypothetical protein